MSKASEVAERARIVAAPAPSLCLDFVNTRYWRGTPQPVDSLDSVDALRDWLAGPGGIDGEADALRALPPAAAARGLAQTLAAREQLYGLLHALAMAQPVPAEAAAALARHVAKAQPRSDLVLTAQARGWRVRPPRAGLADLLAPVWWSASDLVLAAGRLPLRCCANPACGWLFLDDSRRHAPLVLDERLRQPGQGVAPCPAPARVL